MEHKEGTIKVSELTPNDFVKVGEGRKARKFTVIAVEANDVWFFGRRDSVHYSPIGHDGTIHTSGISRANASFEQLSKAYNW